MAFVHAGGENVRLRRADRYLKRPSRTGFPDRPGGYVCWERRSPLAADGVGADDEIERSVHDDAIDLAQRIPNRGKSGLLLPVDQDMAAPGPALIGGGAIFSDASGES